MDEKGRSLQGRLDFCERNVKALQNGVKGMIKNHQGGWSGWMVCGIKGEKSDGGSLLSHPRSTDRTRCIRWLPGDAGPVAAGPRHGRAGTFETGGMCVRASSNRSSIGQLLIPPCISHIIKQEQFIDLQEDLIAIAECAKRLAEERRRIMVREGSQSRNMVYDAALDNIRSQ